MELTAGAKSWTVNFASMTQVGLALTPFLILPFPMHMCARPTEAHTTKLLKQKRTNGAHGQIHMNIHTLNYAHTIIASTTNQLRLHRCGA